MIQRCEESGGVGAVLVADNFDAENYQVLDSYIPVIVVDQHTGIELRQNYLGEEATIVAFDGGLLYTYDELSGTSMASPHVVAAAALVWSHFGENCTNHQIRYALALTAETPDDEKDDCSERYGYGIVDTKAALEWLEDNDCEEWSVPQLSQGGCTTV